MEEIWLSDAQKWLDLENHSYPEKLQTLQLHFCLVDSETRHLTHHFGDTVFLEATETGEESVSPAMWLNSWSRFKKEFLTEQKDTVFNFGPAFLYHIPDTDISRLSTTTHGQIVTPWNDIELTPSLFIFREIHALYFIIWYHKKVDADLKVRKRHETRRKEIIVK
jgi:hypothetical protein